MNSDLMSQNDEYTIVSATESDKEEILKLYKAQVGKKFCFWDEDYPSMLEIDEDVKRNNLFVLKDGKGKILSTISVDHDENVDVLGFWTKELLPGAELARLCVDDSLKNKGIARKMIEHVSGVLKSRGFKSVHFLVNRDNIPALSSYSHLAFDKVGECFMYEQNFICYEKKF